MTKEEAIEIKYHLEAIVEANKKVWAMEDALRAQIASFHRYLNEVQKP